MKSQTWLVELILAGLLVWPTSTGKRVQAAGHGVSRILRAYFISGLSSLLTSACCSPPCLPRAPAFSYSPLSMPFLCLINHNDSRAWSSRRKPYSYRLAYQAIDRLTPLPGSFPLLPESTRCHHLFFRLLQNIPHDLALSSIRMYRSSLFIGLWLPDELGSSWGQGSDYNLPFWPNSSSYLVEHTKYRLKWKTEEVGTVLYLLYTKNSVWTAAWRKFIAFFSI